MGRVKLERKRRKEELERVEESGMDYKAIPCNSMFIRNKGSPVLFENVSFYK